MLVAWTCPGNGEPVRIDASTAEVVGAGSAKAQRGTGHQSAQECLKEGTHGEMIAPRVRGKDGSGSSVSTWTHKYDQVDNHTQEICRSGLPRARWASRLVASDRLEAILAACVASAATPRWPRQRSRSAASSPVMSSSQRHEETTRAEMTAA